MPAGALKSHVLAYDIADPKRLVRVHRTVREWGLPLQYSVFLVYASSTGLNSLLARLDAIIDRRQDDIRVYTLPRRVEMTHYGRQILPEGVGLVGGRLSGENIVELVRGTNQD